MVLLQVCSREGEGQCEAEGKGPRRRPGQKISGQRRSQCATLVPQNSKEGPLLQEKGNQRKPDQMKKQRMVNGKQCEPTGHLASQSHSCLGLSCFSATEVTPSLLLVSEENGQWGGGSFLGTTSWISPLLAMLPGKGPLPSTPAWQRLSLAALWLGPPLRLGGHRCRRGTQGPLQGHSLGLHWSAASLGGSDPHLGHICPQRRTPGQTPPGCDGGSSSLGCFDGEGGPPSLLLPVLDSSSGPPVAEAELL